MRMLAISPFFSSIFYLCEDNAYNFYGRPIVQLSNYQCDLMSWAKYFKNVLSNRHDIPSEVKNNPEELMDWLEIRRNAEDAKIINNDTNNNDGGGGSIVGASKKDYEILGIHIDTKNSLGAKLKAKGGYMSKDDIFKETG